MNLRTICPFYNRGIPVASVNSGTMIWYDKQRTYTSKEACMFKDIFPREE